MCEWFRQSFEFKYRRLHGMNSDRCLHAALGAYDPDPAKTWLSALDAHRVMNPNSVDADFTTSRTRSHDADQGDIRHGAVMAREPTLDRDAEHPWGNGANGVGDGKSPEEGTASPNGWCPNRGQWIGSACRATRNNYDVTSAQGLMAMQ